MKKKKIIKGNFNSRPCVRGDMKSISMARWAEYFNSRPCVRGDGLKYRILNCLGEFQFTPLREGRRTNSF